MDTFREAVEVIAASTLKAEFGACRTLATIAAANIPAAIAGRGVFTLAIIAAVTASFTRHSMICSKLRITRDVGNEMSTSIANPWRLKSSRMFKRDQQQSLLRPGAGNERPLRPAVRPRP